MMVVLFDNSGQLILKKLTKYFVMKIFTWTIQMHNTILKLVPANISRWKETLSKKLGFRKNSNIVIFIKNYLKNL